MNATNGLIYVFTGNGKGKTSAALGTAMRAVGNGMRVAWVAWYKQSSWGMSEVKSLEKLGVDMFLLGKGFHIAQGIGQRVKGSDSIKTAPVGDKGNVVIDNASEEEHVQAAQAALEKVKQLLGSMKHDSRSMMHNSYDLIILDEVNNALHDGLISLSDLRSVINSRGNTHLVLTGRDAHPKIIEAADLVTEMKKIKHPYDAGKLAVKGLDF